jgi:hypothetical protein
MDDNPPRCPRCGHDPATVPGCIPQPGGGRFGMEAPGEPGSTSLASRCPGCHADRGSYHHARCSYQRRHQP